MGGRLTIVVPAWNEERRLAATVEEVVRAAERYLAEYEVIVVNDGSTDRTAEVADGLASRFPRVSVVHQTTNLGVGAAYYEGLSRARFPYLTLVPGDNAYSSAGVEAVLKLAGTTELVISYRANPRARTLMRLILSRCCTRAMRLVTGRPLQDAHSLYVFPVAQARQAPRNAGYGYHIETLATLLRGGLKYTEVPVLLNPRPDSSSKVMRVGVLARLGWTMTRLAVGFLVLRRTVRFRPAAPIPAEPLRKAG
jgi:glycosyltransferase involved in cell wall biosynthesis